MNVLAEQNHDRLLDEELKIHKCHSLRKHQYGYRVRRLACAHFNIQSLVAKINLIDYYHTPRLAEIHELWLQHKQDIEKELKVLCDSKDYNSFILASQQTLQAWRTYYRETRKDYDHVN